MDKVEIVNRKLASLEKSKFRRSFKLKEKERLYIKEKGLKTILDHAYVFVNDRLRYERANDGKQTPMKGHPVFIAMHAVGCCCRGCLYKWHGIEKNRPLRDSEVNYIVYVIMSWIKKEMKGSE